MTYFDTIYIHTYEKSNGQKPTLADRARMRKTCGPYQWVPTEPGQGRGFYQSSRGLACGDSTFDLRLELANDHLADYPRLARVDGYYCDNEGNETLTPIIARLPHSTGFLAGWTMGAGMIASLDSTIHETLYDAAYAAHRLAEYQAERERDNEAQEDTED